MPELFTAIHGDHQICIFDIVDENGQYIEEVRSEYRRASQANELLCPECMTTLELCAGAIVAPYFRHKAIMDCPISRELKTEAGKRMYHGKKMLYSLGKTAEGGNVVLNEGKTDHPFHPVLLIVDEKEEALLYLDGNSRNYQKLREAAKYYEMHQMKAQWFLHKKYQSDSRNITSNEAEAATANGGIIYYLDTENQTIDFRKAYQTPYGERKYYTKSIEMKNLIIDAEGDFNQEFLQDYEAFVREQRRNLDRVLRVPLEEGVEEIYFDYSCVYMDAIEEIWVLPQLGMPCEDEDLNEKAKMQRELYVEHCNEELLHFSNWQRSRQAEQMIKNVNRWRLVCNWLE